MRPLKLTLNSFGPFSKIQTIDFSTINNTIFLITGPTGCGKTTIFDSICFALYGEASNEIKKSNSFKSDFAKLEEKCYVEFSFIIKSKTYNIKRYPQQTRLDRKGNITYTQEKVFLTLDNNEEIVGKKEVDQKIIEILGITKKQFKKIVMLPQGEFKKLLESKSDEKQEIFRKIFSTDIFNVFTENLKQKAKEIEKKLEEIENENKINLKNIDCLENQDLKKSIECEFKNYSYIIELLKQQIDIDENNSKKLKNQIEIYTKEKEKINIENIKEINEKFKTLHKINNKIKNLYLEKSIIKEKEEHLKKLENIKEIIAIESSLTKYIQEKSKKENNLNKIINYHDELKVKLIESNKNIENIKEIEKNISKMAQEIQINKNYIPFLKIKNNILNDLNDLKNKLELSYKHKKNNILLQERLNLINDNKISENKYSLILNLKSNINEYKNIIKKHKKQSDLYDKTLIEYKKNINFIIALDLLENEPCPVCGSTKHPNLAKESQSKITEQDVQLVKNKYEKLIIKKQEIKQIISTILKDLNNESLIIEINNIDNILNSNYIDQINRIENYYESIIKKTNTNIENIEKKIYNENNKNILLIDKSNDIKYLESNITKIKKDIENNKQNIDKLTKELLKIEEENPFCFNSEQEIISEIKKSESKIKKFNLLIDDIKDNHKKINEKINIENIKKDNIKNQLKDIENNIKEIKSQFNTKLSNYGFNKESEYKHFKQQNDNIEIDDKIISLKFEINNYNNILNENINTKKILENQLENKKIINIDEAKDKINKLSKNIKEKNDTYIKVSTKISRNKISLEKLTKNYNTIKNIENKYYTINELSKISSGNNQERLSFERFILAKYFDEVIESANIILNYMLNSRFSLARKKVKEKGSTPSGLDLEVFDNYTCTYRDSSTLSGGESFITSISLALGLSDIISRYQGGIEINTMFIDEGFGTLDNNSLENVLTCLIKLQSNGRLIGIISHIQELKDKIYSQIVISPSKNGSIIVIDN